MEKGYQIPTSEIKGYHRMLKEPNIQMCRNILKQNLFARGLEVEKGDLKDLEEVYLRFLEDAFDYCLFLGFVPYRIVEIYGERVPVVCQPDTFDAYVVTDANNMINIVLYERHEAKNASGNSDVRKEIKDSHIFFDFGHNPDTTGHLHSLMQSIRRELNFKQNLQSCLQKMELKRSDPPVLTESTENSAANAGDDLDYGFFADADLASEAEQAKFMRTDAQMKAIRDQTEIYHQWLGEDEQSAAPSGIFPLPSGQKFVNAPLPDGRHDFVQIRRSIQDLVFGLMGVPRSLIFSDGTHKGDAEGTHATFNSAIAWWKRTLGRCASEAKLVCDAKTIVKTVREKRKADSAKSGDAGKRIRLSSSDVALIRRENATKFVFPTIPSLRMDEVHVLYDRGALSWKQYLETIGMLSGLPMDLSLPEPVQEEPEAPGNDQTSDDNSVRISKDGEVSKKGEQKNPEKKSQTEGQNNAAKESAAKNKKVKKK